MAQHIASIHWQFDGGDFRKGRYSRAHTWRFDGGVEVAASPSPHVVPAPWSDAAAVDPEEAFVASLASCHRQMMTFLFLASRAGFLVERYDDDAVGTMVKNERGRWWVNEVVLKPRIVYGGDKLTPHGLVTEVTEVDGKPRVTVQLWVERQDGTKTSVGTAWAGQPSDKRSWIKEGKAS